MAEFRKLTEDVYAFLRPPLIWYSSAGVIIGDSNVIVVDSLSNAEMARCLLAEISRVTGKPQNHLTLLQGIATEARSMLCRKGTG